MTSNTGQDKWNEPMTIPMAIFDIAVLWYYSFGGSIVLRPMVNAFWITMAIVGIIVFRMTKIPLNRYNKLSFAMLAYLFVTVFFSQDMGVSLKYTLSLLLYFVIAMEITSNFSNLRFFLHAALVYSLVLLMISLTEKYNSVLYTEVFMPFLPAEYNLDILTFIRNGSVNGFFNQTSSNAIAMSLGVGLSIYWIESTQKRRVLAKGVQLFILLAFFFGVILTVRRGSLFVVAAILAYIIYTKRGNRFTKIILAIAIVWLLIFGGISNVPAFQSILYKNQVYSVAGDITNGRLGIWARSLRLFVERPIFGSGVDTFHLLESVISAHNSYIQSLVELGVIGTFFFYMPFVYALVLTIKTRRTLLSLGQEEKALIIFALFWQLYCFGDGVFEAIFASEITVFMMFVAQMMVINILSYNLEEKYEPDRFDQENS